MATTSVTTDCEGPCCCRCTPCAGIGYYDKYDVTVPGIVSYTYSYGGCESAIATIVPSVASPKTYTCTGFETSQATFGTGGPLAPPAYGASPLFGSSGGDGNCRWSYYNVTSSGGVDVMEYIVFKGNSVDVYYQVNSFLCFPHTYFLANASFRAAGTCRVPGNMSYPQDGTIVYSTNPAYATAVPSAGASWQQCGQNSDGTTYTGSVMFSNPFTKSASPDVIKSLPVVPRFDRCDSYLGRDEFRPGCNGWLCAGKCAKGIKAAMPGLFCQTCESYDVDLDFIGQGPEGWFK